jgi:hypothetical protein
MSTKSLHGTENEAERADEYESVEEFVATVESDQIRLPEYVRVHVKDDEIPRTTLDVGSKYGYSFVVMASDGSWIELQKLV